VQKCDQFLQPVLYGLNFGDIGLLFTFCHNNLSQEKIRKVLVQGQKIFILGYTVSTGFNLLYLKIKTACDMLKFVERLWSYVKEGMAKLHGVPRTNFHINLVEQ